MKKLLLSLVAFLAISTTCNELFAQKETRAERRAKNQAENQAINSALSKAIEAQNINYIATEIEYGQSPALQNIQLATLYGLWMEPNYLKVTLPLYGPNNFNGQPSLMHRLDFFVNKYQYSAKPQERGGYEITVTAQDPWSVNTYTFQIMSTPDGRWSYMTVQTPFVGPVTYNGNVVD